MIASPSDHCISLVSDIYCIMVAFDVANRRVELKRRFQLSGYLQAHTTSTISYYFILRIFKKHSFGYWRHHLGLQKRLSGGIFRRRFKFTSSSFVR